MRAFSTSASKQARPCRQVRAAAGQQRDQSRRELVLRSVNVAVLGALFQFGAAPRPDTLGVQDFGSGVKALGLCPKSPNCIATSEEFGDITHFVPSWQYNPEDGRAMKKPATQAQAMQELVDVINELKPDKFEPKIITRTDEYLYVEYESPTFGFIDDVEFWFPPNNKGVVEYRSASRIGESDNGVNRNRIKAIRLALQKKGWQSSGI